MMLGRIWAVAASAAVMIATLSPVQAERLRVPKIDHVATVKECGACHMVFAPQMLPQRSWRAILSSLDNHFGENAVLGESVRADIAAYLVANAADGAVGKTYSWLLRGVALDTAPIRITAMPWWLRAHGEANVANLKNTPIRFAGNCIGCHVGADKTMVFNEPGD